jgi:hypothetical protein
MPATPDDLFAFLDRLGIAHATVTHAPAFTVEEARALRGRVAGAHTKNLFLKDKKDALFLVVALEDAAIELRSLHRRSAGCRSLGLAYSDVGRLEGLNGGDHPSAGSRRGSSGTRRWREDCVIANTPVDQHDIKLTR